MIIFNNLRPLHEHVRQAFLGKLEALLVSSDYIRGAAVHRFEESYAKYVDQKYCVGVASGTDAIRIALSCLDIGPGDEVVTVANSAEGTVTAIRQTGATPVFVDVKVTDGLIDASKIKKMLSLRTKAIVPVCLYGRPVDMYGIKKVSDGIPIILDACQAHGTRANDGRSVVDDVFAACWSFYPTKNLGALGDAGAITTSQADLVRNARVYADYGRASRDQQVVIGINSRMDTLQAGFLNIKLDYLDGWNRERRLLADLYYENLPGAPVTVLPEVQGSMNHHIFAVRSADRDNLNTFLWQQSRVQTMVHYPTPAHLQKANADLGYSSGDLPATEEWCSQTISLPLWVGMPPHQVETVCEHLKAFGK